MKSRRSMKNEKKYYLADLSIYFSTNTDNRINYGPVLAAMFYAPVTMYMGIWDREPNRAKECEKAIKNHVEQFFQMTRSTG